MKHFLNISLIIVLFIPKLSNAGKDYSTTLTNNSSSFLNDHILSFYNILETADEKPSLDLFSKGYIGYLNLKKEGILKNHKVITLIDFSLPSNKKRLWIIDVESKRVILNTLVAHGKNSGNEHAETFSNIANSYQSSLGFYVTGNKYIGKHGLSLRLNGYEKGYNDNALQRAIVLHGANYVSEEFIKKNGRLGRSLGCPAVPVNFTEQIVNLTADGSALFIYKPEKNYLKVSTFLNEISAIEYLMHEVDLHSTIES
jgi:hypothetical protein